MRLLRVLLSGLAGLGLWLALASGGSASEADAYWQCKTSSPAGWCPTSLSNPLPVTVSGGSGTTADGQATAASPTYLEGTANPLSLDLSGNLRVFDSQVLNAINSAIPAGANIIGKVGIDQTTPGTTNAIQVTGALPAGSALIGKVNIDQTAGGVTAADGSALTFALKGFALAGGYNGSTIDMIRSGDVNNVAAATGYLNALSIGRYNATLPTLTDTRYNTLQVGSRGGLHVDIYGADGTTGATAITAGVDGRNNTTSALVVSNFASLFNGSTWDRAFTCPNTATVSVTAANTTELVSLTAAQIIRVCSFVLTESLAGTAKFVYGTGTNCGSGTTDITAAMTIATNANLALSASAGGSLLRTIASNALCLTAVTGNITGFITYVKY